MAKELFMLIFIILAAYHLASITLIPLPLFTTTSDQDVEDTPVAVNKSVTTAEDNQSTIFLDGSDIDGGKTPLQFILVSKPTFGNLSTITITGINSTLPNITYTLANTTYFPMQDFHGNDNFTFLVNDSITNNSDIGTVLITVDSVNDPPVVIDDKAATNEDDPININVIANDTDIDSNTLNVTSRTTPSNGTAGINANNNTITYTPNANFFGTDKFDYTISDGNNGTASAQVTVVVNPVNDPPVVIDDKAATNEDDPININVVANDTDIDSNTLNVTAVTPPRNGTAIFNETTHTITYTPESHFIGVDAFGYTVSDGNVGGNDSGIVAVTIKKVLEAVREFAPASLGIAPDAKSFLTVSFEGPSSIQEAPTAAVTVQGSLAAANGSGINDQYPILVQIYNKDNKVINYTKPVSTNNYGFYEFTPGGDNGANFPKGTYIANASATNPIYKGRLIATKELIVEGHPPSIPVELWGPLYGLIPAFLIPSGLAWYNGWRQRGYLARYRNEIDVTYDTYKESDKQLEERKKECSQSLDKLETRIIEELEKGNLTESQYEILKDRISEFKKKVA